MTGTGDPILVKKKLKQLIKILTDQADDTLEAAITRHIGGEAPTDLSITNPDILLEPYYWLLVFAKLPLEANHLRDDLGVPGRIVTAFTIAFRNHFGGSKGVTSWQEAKIQSLINSLNLLGFHYLRYPANIKTSFATFSGEVKHDVSQTSVKHDGVYEVITHLEWDRIKRTAGKKTATKFMMKTRLRSQTFSRRNRGCVGTPVKDNKDPEVVVLDDDYPDVVEEDSERKKEPPRPSYGKQGKKFQKKKFGKKSK